MAGVSAAAKEFEPWVAWLPTIGDQPVASSPLIAEPPAGADRAEVAPWGVTGLRLTPDQAVELLCAGAGRQTLAPGVVVGKTLGFWPEFRS